MPGESIGVYARVRGSSDEVSTAADKPGSLTVRNLEFTLDAAYDSAADQQAVYDGAAHAQVERVLQGFNATILAYGQTGSGKTYTMLGPEDADFDDPTGPNLGVIPRACGTLFSKLPAGHTVSVSYVEVYNDAVNDLLGKGEDLKLHARGQSVVPDGLKLEPVTSVKEVMAAIKLGDTRRVIAAMAMNPRSSRGHGIVQIHVKTAKGEAYGRLTLADLAGMESSKKSAAVEPAAGSNPSASAARREEAKRINTSLLALSSVISALAANATRVPYRDSKLTRLLQDSLGGNCKCAIIVTVRCEKQNIDEAINTLRFAQRAKNVTVNLVSNAQAASDSKPKAAKLAEELDAAKSALGEFEEKLASSEQHKEQLLAEVNNLMAEMQLLQREQASAKERHDARARASVASGGGGGEDLSKQVRMLEARVEQLEEENRMLRQREIMRKMFILGDEAAQPEATKTTPRPMLLASSHPAPPVAEPAAFPQIQMPVMMRGFTQRQLVCFEPLGGFGNVAEDEDAFAVAEDGGDGAATRSQTEEKTSTGPAGRKLSFVDRMRKSFNRG